MCYYSAGKLQQRKAQEGEFLYATVLHTGGVGLKGDTDHVIACIETGTVLQVAQVPPQHKLPFKVGDRLTFEQRGTQDRINYQGFKYPFTVLDGFRFQVVPAKAMTPHAPTRPEATLVAAKT